ncbi:nuclease SbcCD subunit D [Longimycelium tulufanense]|uniref:Nuclease SbcCD subunit D n=1 Tax=Longimycelium tulufanense TaxID=907463 RepID=A0A8J3CBC3_9PSEU|nr:exonuclease SbcCD subunit D [Longimycelium tulufanense]GGM69229.1 nuclease SbcCD subunit D [Longimycelium tulufanense]
MRLLHTSDWHVGRTFHGRDLLAEQEEVLSGLAEVVIDQEIDVVLVAGDLYDRAVPSAEAVDTCHRILRTIARAGARIVITSGNHDSAPRLGAFADFAAAGGLHLRTRVSTLQEPVIVTDDHGPVAIYGIPYLEPDPVRHLFGLDERGHTAVLTEAMNRIRADLAARPDARSVVLAHAFVTGGQPSESERPISVGGVEQVPASVFDGVDYVALGHLHGPQRISERVRYSGSPLAYSFSEIDHRKSVWLVDLDANGLAAVERRELPVPRRLATVTGLLDDLLTVSAHAPLEERFLYVVLTDPVRPLDAMRKLRERFPHTVRMEWQPVGGRATAELSYAEAMRGRDDHEVACGFLTDCRGSEPTESERALLKEALEAVSRAEVAR